MLNHLVLFKFAEKPAADKLNEMHEALLSMKGKIPQIQHVTGGEDLNRGQKGGFHYGLHVQVENVDALQAYLSHPHHVSVVEKNVKPLNAEIVAVDYFA